MSCMAEMLTQAQTRSPELGIEVVDVRVKRIDLSEEVSDSVYLRMRQERQRVATQLRAEGEEQSERIRADAERQRTVILSEAYRDAERIRGAGDARATDIYARRVLEGSRLLLRSIEACRLIANRSVAIKTSWSSSRTATSSSFCRSSSARLLSKLDAIHTSITEA